MREEPLEELDPEDRLEEPDEDDPVDRLLEPVDRPVDPDESDDLPVELDPFELSVPEERELPDLDDSVDRVVPLERVLLPEDREVDEPVDLDLVPSELEPSDLVPSELVEEPVDLVPEDLELTPLRFPDAARVAVLPVLIVVREVLFPSLEAPMVERVVRIGFSDFPAELELPDAFTTVLDPRSAIPVDVPPVKLPRLPLTPTRPPLISSSRPLVNALLAMVAPRAP